MKDIPCKNCITLSMCKSQAIDLTHQHPRINLNSLLSKCCMFREYCIKLKYVSKVNNESDFLYIKTGQCYTDIFKFFIKGQENKYTKLSGVIKIR